MKIISNKHTLLYNCPTIHSIQRDNGLSELTTHVFQSCIALVQSNCANGKKFVYVVICVSKVVLVLCYQIA